MIIDSEASAREYIRSWLYHSGDSGMNASRFIDTAKSQRAAAGLCRNETEREGHITAARTLEAEAARIELDLLNSLDTDEE